MIYGLFQQQESMRPVGISRAGKGVFSVVGLTLALVLSGNVVWGCAALALVWGLMLWIYDLSRARRLLALRRLGPFWGVPDARRLLRLAVLALPLGIVMLALSLESNLPRYFIADQLGERNLGIFAAIAYFMVASCQIGVAVWQAASPRLARFFAQGERNSFLNLLGRLAVLALGLGVGGYLVAVLWGRQLLVLCYEPLYADHAGLFRWLMLAGAAMQVSSLLGHAVTAVRQFKIQVPLNGGFVLVTAGLCAVLVPAYGLRGAAWSVLAAAIAQIPLKVWILARSLKGAYA
jgi:O-antigen/teichoic acid export membrane protein